jgi:hypothetical protein
MTCVPLEAVNDVWRIRRILHDENVHQLSNRYSIPLSCVDTDEAREANK